MTMIIKKLWKLPIASNAINFSYVQQESANVTWLLFDYKDNIFNNNYRLTILFFGVQEIQHNNKKLTTKDLELCDYLVEFIDFDWMKKWQKHNKNLNSDNDMKHYGIMLDNNVFYEIIAEKYSIVGPQKGLIKEMTLDDFD